MAKRQIQDYVFTPGVAGVGKIKILDKVLLDRFLLISNVTKNKILYNFADPTNQIQVHFEATTDESDPDYPYANTISNGITEIILLFDTSDQSSTDALQIFIESEETIFRPYNFGTDAIERMRVATPQSMLDADFEYGLQPTKWQTIDLIRGYPSIYEVPGSELNLYEITTDASSPGGGVGDSLITVTLPQTHGFSVGYPVRIFGLDDSIPGASRATGSFIIDSVGTTTSFTYYAKGKVGTTNGTSLLTSNSQLRRGAYYTGAGIGDATFSVFTQGSNGSFNTNLVTPSGSNGISFSGTAPAIGAPLVGFGIVTGTQVTGIATTTIEKTLGADIISPTNTITVNDPSNIQIGAAVNNGIGTATFVTNITGNTLSLSNPMLVNYTGSSNQLGNFIGTPLFGNGSDALFDVDRINGEYKVSLSKVEKTVTAGIAGSTYVEFSDIVNVKFGQNVVGTGIGIGASVIGFVGISTVELSVANSDVVSGIATFFNIGIGYTVNDRIVISGSALGGDTSDNDLIVRIGSVDETGGITSITAAKEITLNGTPVISTAQAIFGTGSMLLNPTDGTADYVSIASTSEFEFGTGDFTIDFWIYRNRTGATEILYDMRTSPTEAVPVLYLDNGDNKVRYSINGTDVISGVTTATASTWHHIALSREGTTTRLFVDGNLDGTYNDTNNYPQRPVNIGARYDGFSGFYGYIDEVRVSKGLARFTSAFTTDDVTFINDVYNSLYLRFRGLNNSTTFSDDSKGTAISSSQFYGAITGITTGNGTNSTFDILRVGGASTDYSVSIGNPGAGYQIEDVIIIDGSVLGGQSGTNNLSIIVDNIDGANGITAISFTGTASNGNLSRKALGDLDFTVSNSGSGALFNVTKNESNYSVDVTNSGQGYYPEYQVKISGTELGGSSPTNDLIITTDSLNINTLNLGTIQNVSVSGTPVVGSAITFYPAVTLSEVTTAKIAEFSSVSFSSLAKILVDFTSNHGLVPGDTLLVSIGSNGTNHQLASGPRIVDEIPALDKLVYNARSPGAIAAGLAGTVYTRPDCFYIHRPFDGGVQLGTGGPAHGAHAIRQSKKYLRYQSGKGIMYTTGTLFAPAYDLRSVTASGIGTGSVITVTTDDVEHGLQNGAEIILSNITTPGYSGNYIVNNIISETSFTVLATNELGSTTAELGIQAQVSLYKWKGATVRAGAFDDQNGIFWQYDGVSLAVGLRSATYQLAGTVGIGSDSNNVVGTNTKFREQLIVGNRIVIRGMTHVVTNIESNTSMTVTPDFRGVRDVSGAKAALVNEIIIPQHQWNIDRCDGQGPSGYHLEVNKMQMIGFQYTWYGAGFIDWMLRGPNGDYLFVHRLKNNNRNTEAFMRSGNLPVRYEVINEGTKTKLTQNIGIGSTQIFVDRVDLLPSSGSLYIDNEIINYTGIEPSTNSLTGITRGATFTNFYSGSQRSYSGGNIEDHTSGTGIVLLSNTATPVISHWGSAFLTDGLFDSDRGYIFNYQSVNFTITTIRTTAFLIRLAPSVSNAITGDLGERELINRAQLLLQGIEFTATGGSANQGIVIEGVLNPQNYPSDPQNITWSSLNNAATGGQPSFAQVADGTSVDWGVGSSFTATNSIAGNSYAGNKTNFVYFTPASVTAAKVGQVFSGTGVPGGTLVRRIFDSQRFPGNKYVELSQSIDRPGNIGSSTYTFTDPTSAASPGETVFSFIGSGGGGNTASLDLSDLKELNNTPIGGRGTFPNGPDVLAINVYATSGTQLTGSLVLRWGEAQA